MLCKKTFIHAIQEGFISIVLAFPLAPVNMMVEIPHYNTGHSRCLTDQFMHSTVTLFCRAWDPVTHSYYQSFSFIPDFTPHTFLESVIFQVLPFQCSQIILYIQQYSSIPSFSPILPVLSKHRISL